MIFAAFIPVSGLEAEALQVCEQLMLPRDPELRMLQADLLDQWVRRRRATGYESELEDAEVVALAAELRLGNVAALVRGTSSTA